MAVQPVKPVETNEDRRASALCKKIQKAHDWRVQVWAQSELRIKASQEALAVLGRDPVTLYEPDFSDPEVVRHYAEMSLNG